MAQMHQPARLMVEWEGPIPLPAFIVDAALKKRFDVPGVYVWIETLPSATCRLSYVGRAAGSPTLWKRQVQHYAATIGGLSTIPKEFRPDGTLWVPDWTLPETVAALLDRGKFSAVVEDGFRYAAAVQVYLWRVPIGTDVRVVERNLLYDLRPAGTDWGTRSLPTNRLRLCHKAPAWLTTEIQTQIRPDVEVV